MNRIVRVLVTGVSVVALGLTAYATTAGAAPAGESGARPTTQDAELLAAMQRDLGLRPEQAKALRAEQAKAADVDGALREKLGAAYGGSWFDAKSGKLVVGVTDAARVAEVTRAGAKAKVVARGLAELDAVKAELDALSGKAAGADRAENTGKSALPGLVSWHVDPVSNTVAVTALEGQARSAGVNQLAKFGGAVRVSYTATAPTQTANYLDGGDEINGASCSAGFNLRNPATGQGFLLTAGHCVSTGSTLTGQGGVAFGPVLESWFPTYDDALIRNDNPGYWIQGPWVDTNPSNGGIITVSGYSDSPVGTLMCKSGITTKWTCGYIRAKDETVNYAQGAVYGMTRHSACVEPGDSGGANVAALSVWSPEGVTSGAQLYWDGSRYRCAAAVGAGESVSWYYPIADSLAHYGPRYGVTTW